MGTLRFEISSRSARAGNRRFGTSSALRAHTKAPYKIDLLWKTLRPLKCPGRARTVARGVAQRDHVVACRGTLARVTYWPT
jgi:hypothetical protein